MARKARSIKFSEEEWAQVERAAEREDTPVSTYVRSVALTAASPTLRERRERVLAELFAVGGDVRDLRRDLKSEGYEHDRVAVGQLLDHLRETIDRAGGYAVVGAPGEEDSPGGENDGGGTPLAEQEP